MSRLLLLLPLLLPLLACGAGAEAGTEAGVDHVGCLPDSPLVRGGQTPVVCQYGASWQLCSWGQDKYSPVEELTFHASEGGCSWRLVETVPGVLVDTWDSATWGQCYNDLPEQERAGAQVWERAR